MIISMFTAITTYSAYNFELVLTAVTRHLIISFKKFGNLANDKRQII